MLVWLIKDGETLPIQPGVRRMRTGLLADELLRRGHTVVWWSSTFSHQRKELLYNNDVDVDVLPRFALKLIHAGVYSHNISFKRYRHHRILSSRFGREAPQMVTPEIVVCSFPTIDLAGEVVKFTRERRVPLVIDVRDLWPDVFLEHIPRCLRRIARLALRRLTTKTGCILRDAQSIVGISQGYLRWALAHAGRQGGEWDRVFYLGCDPRGVEVSGPSERIDSLSRTLKGKVIFTFIGSFGHSYELTILCAVARRVTTMGLSAIHFILAGDGEQYGDISKRAAALSNMTLLGWLNRDEMGSLLAVSNVGLAPCLHVPDSLPNKVFEYLSAGLPILSSLEGEMAEIISQSDIGFHYQRGNVAALCEYVVQLGTNSVLRMGQARNARKLFAERFSSSVVYQSYASHVETVAQG